MTGTIIDNIITCTVSFRQITELESSSLSPEEIVKQKESIIQQRVRKYRYIILHDLYLYIMLCNLY